MNRRKLIKVKSRQEIAWEYGIDRKTFYYWLKKSNLQLPGGVLCPSDIKKIYRIFGNPYLLNNR
jgi:5-formaminoimidazole-4-carboxamide-1-beta-D-ribofuranosyl 5'-monophosphate synthetase